MTRVSLLVSLLSIAGLALAPQAPALAGDDTEMIVGGTPAPDGKYPFQVRIYGSPSDTIGFCGGSIIDAQWVLTAAHCLMDTQAVTVGFGSTDRTKTTKIDSEKIIVHPSYLAGQKADIALIKLKSPIPDAPAIEVTDTAKDQKLLTPGAKATVTGWGAIWDMQAFHNALDVMAGRRTVSERRLLDRMELEAPVKLHEVDIEVIDPQACKAVYQSLQVPAFSIGDTEICATGPQGGKDSCFGDSGGPLFGVADNGKFVQVGVVSWGPQCGNPLYPGVYTRVSSFSDWINKTLAAN